MLSRETRKYLYAVFLAALPIVVALGWLEAIALPLAVPLITALLNLTPEDKPDWVE